MLVGFFADARGIIEIMGRATDSAQHLRLGKKEGGFGHKIQRVIGLYELAENLLLRHGDTGMGFERRYVCGLADTKQILFFRFLEFCQDTVSSESFDKGGFGWLGFGIF